MIMYISHNITSYFTYRYRAKVEKIEGPKVTVFFTDYGNVSHSYL